MVSDIRFQWNGLNQKQFPIEICSNLGFTSIDKIKNCFLFQMKIFFERNLIEFLSNIPGVPSDPGCVLNFLHDVNARQEQIRSEGISPVSIFIPKYSLNHILNDFF